MKYYEDPILGKGRAADVSGGTGSASEYVGGYRITIAGQTISSDRYMPIETVTGNSVTMQAGHAYKVVATTSAVTLNTETIPANSFGLEGHLEIFVAGTGYVVTGTNVVLAQPLEPDSVNNCTVRFHDGVAIISVEDHVAGYIVISVSGTANGSLYYGLATSTNEYIAFDATTNGSAIDMGGAVTNTEKHVVGNGYSDTILTGGVSCTSKTTFANLAMSGAAVTGGTMTLGDVYIPSGATVSVSGGGLAVEKVTGNGGVVDLNQSTVSVAGGIQALISGCTVTNGKGSNPGAFNVSNSGTVLTFSSATISGNRATNAAGGLIAGANTTVQIISSVVSGNSADISIKDAIISGTAIVDNSTIGEFAMAGTMTIKGNTSVQRIMPRDATHSGLVTISSGAIIDLTGNTNANPIEPGGGITFSGANQIIYGESGATTTAYIDGCTAATIASGGVVQLSTVSGGIVTVPRSIVTNGDWSASNCEITGGSAGNGGNVYVSAGTASFVYCKITSGTVPGMGGGAFVKNGATAVFSDCIFEDNNSNQVANRAIRCESGASGVLKNCTFKEMQTVQIGSGANGVFSGTMSFGSGATVSAGGSLQIIGGAAITMTNAAIVNGGVGTIEVTGGITVNGHPIVSGTYTQINADGTTVPAQPA